MAPGAAGRDLARALDLAAHDEVGDAVRGALRARALNGQRAFEFIQQQIQQAKAKPLK